jgi:hypothetical protein
LFGVSPFQILERINDNSYKIDLSGKFNIRATFNFSALSLFDVMNGHILNRKGKMRISSGDAMTLAYAKLS